MGNPKLRKCALDLEQIVAVCSLKRGYVSSQRYFYALFQFVLSTLIIQAFRYYHCVHLARFPTLVSEQL
jgi:hypothetical protein